ncbi:MAG TPA: DUF488 domain-containing protein [Methylophilaceae bacterium]|nr:DUF488 domain-containing protein [Methylophilaceae bacterium]
MNSQVQRSIYTIGHSTRPIEEFVKLLQSHDVGRLLDIRTIPKSRHNPQFGNEKLAASLKQAGIEYTHLAGLGGLRHTTAESPNKGWRNTSFRGYADYMQTPEFADSLQEAIDLSAQQQVALMCAEVVPWRCHRSMVADALIVRGFEVEEIVNPEKRQHHKLTPFAVVEGLRITYPPAAPQNGELF